MLLEIIYVVRLWCIWNMLYALVLFHFGFMSGLLAAFFYYAAMMADNNIIMIFCDRCISANLDLKIHIKPGDSRKDCKKTIKK